MIYLKAGETKPIQNTEVDMKYKYILKIIKMRTKIYELQS